ncbi:hypothetical protein [Vibrio cincinnatiensis]|uniref:hypothetical protein n=1 Tax=Vibrio cincinnatiensis TaxID=675 RepID=UPI001EDE75BA|nr:hypothetical protein [Vibrio cincinnatiensis]EKO3875078.1 hypothetical protein [Vibrio metschnikovii]MCG3726318.1 phage tail protein [Vibrio cincinnatiensis]
MTPIKDPVQYAKLPSGTKSYCAPIDDPEQRKLLKDMNAIGTTGKKSGFVQVDRLIDTEPKFIADDPEAPDKEWILVDDTGDENTAWLLEKAEKTEAVIIYIEFPNGRWAEMTIALGGWELKELEKGKPMMLAVAGKQNSIKRGIIGKDGE